MLSAWLCIEWVALFGSYHHRPTALGRFHALLWMYIGSYILLVATAIGQNNYHIAASYFLVTYFASVFLALLISYLELFALPSKENWAQTAPQDLSYPAAPSGQSSRPHSPGNEEAVEDDEANERTSLLRGDRHSAYNTYSANRRSSVEDTTATSSSGALHLDGAQSWSGNLPSWTWILQLLLLAPINIILIGQISLLVSTGLHQTIADGSPVLTVYFFMAISTLLILTTFRPFLHKLNYRIWWLLAVVLIGTLIYNLLAFPFSMEARLKVFFIQRVDLDSGANTVSLLGLDEYVQQVALELPSTAGQNISCTDPSISTRRGLVECSWAGLEPAVTNSTKYKDWLSYKVKRVKNDTAAVFTVFARDSRACKLVFETPVAAVNVTGSATDHRTQPVGKDGSNEVRLWHRKWEEPWEVSVRWNGTEQDDGLSGQVVCLWSDANTQGAIPALDEVFRFAPAWSIVSKASDGLVEGFKTFSV